MTTTDATIKLGMIAPRPSDIPKLVGVAALYALLATIVLRLFAENGIVSIVWPPSGLAVAALLLGGRKFAPAIWCGALAANLLAGASLPLATTIAFGNTLEALTACWLLQRDPGFSAGLRDLRDLLRLIVVGALVPSIVSALTGSIALLAAGVIDAAGWPSNLVYWWMGDLLGIVLVTPLIMTWRQPATWRMNGRRVEAIALFGLIVLFGQVVFLDWLHDYLGQFARGYWFFLFNIVAALRLGSPGVMALLTAVAVQGLWGATANTGFFSGGTMTDRLLAYWGYMLVLTVEGLVLAIYIEQLRRAQASLKRNEDKLNRAQAVAKIGSWELDMRSNVLTWTPESYRIFGVAPGTPLTYETFLACVHPDDRNYVHARWSAAAHGAPYDIEHRIVANGAVRWVNERADLRFAPDGQLISGIGITQDITERKEFEAEHAKLSLAIAQSSDSILITDAQGQIEFVNTAFTQTTGYAPEEVLGRNPNLLKSGTTPPEIYKTMWQTLRAGNTWRGEIVNRRKDGGQFIANQTLSPIRQQDGTITHYLSISEDITEKRRIADELERHRHHLETLVAERTAKLEATETRLRLILESTADGLYGSDMAGCFNFVNPAACRLLGYTREELIGRPVHATIHHSHPDGTPYPVDACSQHLSLFKGQPIRSADDVFWRADGQPLPVEVAGQPMFSDGKIVGTVVSFTDIGMRKLAESARETARAEAERLARTKSDFLSNMSHEIRTPLGAVMGLARIGIRENRGRQAHETCSRILDAGQHLLAVVNDILDFSKIEAGKLSIESQPLQLRSIIETSVGMLHERAAAKGLQLSNRMAPDLPEWVAGDPLRIRQILVNLLSNAIKFTERGEIGLAVLRNDAEIWFTVTDPGIGMTEEQLSRLFKPFEQADGSTTRKFGGTGLGLSISMNLASLMGGGIQVASTPGRGSTFTLHLPLPETAPPSTADYLAMPGDGTPRRLEGLNILAAEDVEVNRFILADLLEEEGATFVFAENGRQAVAQATANPQGFDAVLMDVQMPIMDGIEATRNIRKIAPELPIIGLSAHALAEERDKSLAAGMVEHVTKPIEPDELVAAILKSLPRKTTPTAHPVDTAPINPAVPAGAVPPEPTFADEIDWQVLDQRFRGKQAFIHRLARAALDSQSDTPADLRRLAETKDFAALAFLAHTLKGLGGNMAATAVQELAARTEKAAREQDEQAVFLARQLAEKFGRFLDELDVYANRKGSA